MTLHCIAYPSNREVTELLEIACAQKSVGYQEINPDSFSYTAPPALPAGDLLYRASPGQGEERAAITVERFLLRPNLKTFYQEFERSLVGAYSNSYVFHQKANLPIPPTINHLTRDRKLLRRYVNDLGGFPIIIKVLGGSHGVGVMQVDSYPALFSLVDYLPLKTSNIVMRKFIATKTHARLIVLGDQVVDSIQYTAPPNDFRTNVGATPQVKPQHYAESARQLAVQAVTVLGVEFGGVDLLFDDQENAYITEVNFPCNFARAQATTTTDIAGLMIDYLRAKKIP